MEIGVVFPFPQSEIGADPFLIRDFAQAVEGLGYSHLAVAEHVLGIDPTNRPGWEGFTHRDLFHEPFVLFGYLAALTHLELLAEVLILPQRQTVLVAKQAAEVDVLSGGKLRLGVGTGWVPMEYEALGMDYHIRGRVIEEQIEVLRLLWSQEVVSYQGRYHRITEAGLNPLPLRRSIPIWIGGHADAVLRRTARLGDGWLPLGDPNDEMREAIDRLRLYTREAGRDPAQMGIGAHLDASEGDLDEWVRQTDAWQALGATHIVINTSLAKVKSLDERIDLIRRYKEAIAG
jgi:probable F420-dependent oxidoreductase